MENMHTDVRVQKVKQRFKQNTQYYLGKINKTYKETRIKTTKQ